MVREFLAAYVKSVEGIGAVGAVFEQIFLGLGELFARLILAEAVAAIADTGGLDCQNQVFVVRAVEERHEALLSGKRLVDEKIFLIVSHGITEVNRFDAPTVPFKFVPNSPVEVLVVDGIVRTERRCIVVENHGFILMRGVVAAEVLDECRYLTLELDVERFDDIEPSATGLTGHNPVIIG